MRGIVTDKTEMSSVISGVRNGAKADSIIQTANDMLNKRGAEGQTSHSENGISRSYENADIPSSMLKVVTPHVGVIK